MEGNRWRFPDPLDDVTLSASTQVSTQYKVDFSSIDSIVWKRSGSGGRSLALTAPDSLIIILKNLEGNVFRNIWMIVNNACNIKRSIFARGERFVGYVKTASVLGRIRRVAFAATVYY
ncbi:conserved hypothetical protein [Ricinus communis]|uniref:Uncharacterized protein n=1 Tax=Ricinus communis TaxID=3988 RepID=B9RH59_RICCO|nr:conserved hypothetical protein [Ricinus communis]